MSHLLESWINGVPPGLVYVLVALLIGMESMGVPLPGEIALVSALVLAMQTPSLNPWYVGLAGIIGAVVGDSTGYLFGHFFGDKVFQWLGRVFPKHFSKKNIEYAQEKFKKGGVFAVFIGRFVALLRILAGPLSGSLHMHYWKFLLANVTGAICWAGGITVAVVEVGQQAEKYFSNASYILLGLCVVGTLATWLFMRGREKKESSAHSS